MNSTKRSQILGFYMIVFVVLALVCLSTLGWTDFDPALVYLSLALMLAVGILRIGDKDTSGSAGSFTNAFRLILSQRWLRLLLLTAIVLRIADGLLRFGIERHFLAGSHGPRWMMAGPHWPSIYGFSSDVVQSIRWAAEGFFPRTGVTLGGTGAFTALAVLCALPFLRGKLRDLQSTPEHLSDLRLFKRLLPTTALLCMLVFVGQPVLTWMQYARMAARHAPMNPVNLGLMQAWGVLPQISAVFIGVVLYAGLMAGISGSLLRAGKREVVTLDTFVADLVRFSKPIAGLYVLMFIAEQLIFSSGWWWLNLHSPQSRMTTSYVSFTLTMQTVLDILLMFAPFLVVAGYKRGRDLFSMSIRQWFLQRRKIWKFLAVGLTIGATIMLPIQFMHECLGSSTSFIRIVSVILDPFFEAFGSILMLCAVWTFYQRNFLTEEPRHQEVEVQV